MGRATVDRKKMKRYFEQAVEADPQNAYPKYALAHDYAAAGDFSKAKPLAVAALQLMPNHTDIESQVFQIRFALKEYASLEKELKQKLLENPRNAPVVLNLMQVQAAQGGIQRARETQSQFEQTLKQNNPLSDNDTGLLTITSKLMLHYLENDMQAILRECAESQNPTIRTGFAFAANFELGNLADAENNVTEEMAGKLTTEDVLLFSLAWSRKGDSEKAAEWRKKAIEIFRSGTEKNETIAAMLESGNVDLDELDGLELVGAAKTALLAVLADVCKDHRRELLDYAEKINTNTFFPHHFLKRTIEEMKADR
jgi:tetratricopeptide (TPR) repeat protein